MKHLPTLSSKILPASFFALTLGLAETGNAWRFAHDLWALPSLIGELFLMMATVSFLIFITMYARKWLLHGAAASAEVRDPVQSAFLALIPESVILIALALLPYDPSAARLFFWAGSAANLLYGAWRLAAHWSQQRDAAHIVPPLFLPYTAGVLVNALVAGVLDYTNYGWMLFGVGVISWIIMDSAITHQLMTGRLAEKTRNFMGIYSAPPVAALVAYQVLAGTNATPAITYALAGYALFIFAGLAFSARWLVRQDFAPGYWAYTFALATLGQGLMLIVIRHPNSVLETVAAIVFAATLLLVTYVMVSSIRLLKRGAYFPLAPAPVSV